MKTPDESEVTWAPVPTLRADLVGQRFGYLTVVADLGMRDPHNHYWRAQCECGGTTELPTSMMKRAFACRRCFRKRRDDYHGMRQTPEWRAWSQMMRRCFSVSVQNYPYYGGRGITVCERWRSFRAFYEDMAPRPPGTELDRIDNDGDYEPGNCRWATRTEQMRNTRHNRLLTAHGETLLLTDWARRLGVSHTIILSRLRRGWPVEAALRSGDGRLTRGRNIG